MKARPIDEYHEDMGPVLWKPAMTDRYYLTYDKDPKVPGMLLAVISIGQPQLGHQKIIVCSATRVPNRKAAKRWYRHQMQTKPWETRQ